MGISTIENGTSPWAPSVEALLNYVTPGQGDGITTFGDARTRLNAAATALGLPTIGNDTTAQIRAKINAMIEAIPVPAHLFMEGEPGDYWFFHPDYLYTDVEGTVPVTEPGQSVACVRGGFGRFNATQPTAAARPTYGIVPATGRRNLLTYSEDFENGVWVKGSFTGTVTDNTADTTDPLGGSTAGKLDATAANGFIQQYVSVGAATHTYSFYAKAGTASSVWVNVFDTSNHWAVFSLADGSVSSAAGITSSEAVDAGNGWWRLSITYSGGAATNSTRIFCSEIGVIYVWGAQLELGSTPTPYQRVASQYDVTEEGVPSLHYLVFDGVDDFLVTPSIDFTGTDEMSVFAGVRKLSDAAAGTVAELSTSVGTGNGSFQLAAPSTSNSTYGWRIRGTSLVLADTAAGYISPHSAVLTGQADISGDSASLRVNGALAASSSNDQGSGNFGNFAMYIGMRNGSSFPFTGHLYGLIVRGKLSTEAEITATESWMADKTGVEL